MEIVLVGRSNVGKSSIIRGLTGKKVVVGKRPGVTRRIVRCSIGKMDLVDMPGFGFMSGVPRFLQEKIKTEIVRYLEKNRNEIVFAVEVVDASSFSEIVERWQKRGQIPVDVEMFSFLNELNLRPIVVVNKMDLIPKKYRDAVLDDICEKLNLPPPWRQWIDILVPVSAKTGEGIAELKKIIKQRIQDFGLVRYLNWLK
ncbi:MAG: GTP-binding protein EngB [Candidatus Hadarchaeaceae archaeon]